MLESIGRLGTDLRIHEPEIEASSATWLINGFSTNLHVWTADEWQKLENRPSDAQPLANGCWAALRVG